MSQRRRLILATVAFLGWMTWLGCAALMKSHAPIVSRIQAAGAKYQIVAEVLASPDGKPPQVVTVAEWLTGDSQRAGTEIFVGNLPQAKGFDGEGQYLLLLVPDLSRGLDPPDGPEMPRYLIVGQQRSPGSDMTNYGPPLIYKWDDDVRKQLEQLKPQP